MEQGSCLCGAVTFQIRGEMNTPEACHCIKCRKQTGHFFAFTDVYRTDLKVAGQEHIKWFRSSQKVQRGFCGTCGSTLFWAPIYKDYICVALGAIDLAPGTKVGTHVFESENGDAYDDHLPPHSVDEFDEREIAKPAYVFDDQYAPYMEYEEDVKPNIHRTPWRLPDIEI
jgi:hypothetical protein